jgi:hypothetical protein
MLFIIINYNIVCDYKKRRSAAGYLGLSEKTLAMMRCQGTGPHFIKRGRIFYYQEDLDNWLGQAKRVTSTAQAKLQTM